MNVWVLIIEKKTEKEKKIWIIHFIVLLLQYILDASELIHTVIEKQNETYQCFMNTMDDENSTPTSLHRLFFDPIVCHNFSIIPCMCVCPSCNIGTVLLITTNHRDHTCTNTNTMPIRSALAVVYPTQDYNSNEISY